MAALEIPQQFNTSRLSMQRLRYEDAEEIFYAYAGKPEATHFVSWPTHQSIADTRAYLRHAVGAWSKGIEYAFSVRLTENSRLIGSIGVVHDHQGKLQVGYIFSPTQWGRGYATETCQGLLAILVTLPGIYRIQSFTDADNKASEKVLRKCGFIEEARLPQWFRFVNQNNAVKDCIHFRVPLPRPASREAGYHP